MTFIAIIGLGILFLAVCGLAFIPIILVIEYTEQCMLTVTRRRNELELAEEERRELKKIQLLIERQQQAEDEEQRRARQEEIKWLAEQRQRRL